MMKIAFAFWKNRLSPVFDTARQIHVIEAREGAVVRVFRERLPEALPVQKIWCLLELGIDTLVCGAISRPFQDLIAAYGIRVVPFITGELPEVIEAWLGGRLFQGGFVMPGCAGAAGRGGRRMRQAGRKNRGAGKGRKAGAGAAMKRG